MASSAPESVEALSAKLDTLMSLLGQQKEGRGAVRKPPLLQQKWAAARIQIGKEQSEKRSRAQSRWRFAREQYELHRAEELYGGAYCLLVAF